MESLRSVLSTVQFVVFTGIVLCVGGCFGMDAPQRARVAENPVKLDPVLVKLFTEDIVDTPTEDPEECCCICQMQKKRDDIPDLFMCEYDPKKTPGGHKPCGECFCDFVDNQEKGLLACPICRAPPNRKLLFDINHYLVYV